MDGGNAFDQIAPSFATSSATSSSYSSLQCDIFINHRGPDVKHKLARTIYQKLHLSGFRVFLDVEVLEAGDIIPLEIQRAIRRAYLHIAIFSPNYAQSPWCLAELSFMLKTGTKIIPIFYYVDPSDLRWVDQNKGIYADAFSQHQEKGRYTPEKLHEWMKALHDVSFHLGYLINDNSRDEARLLKDVMKCVVKAMNRVSFEVAKHPVGMDEAVENFERNALHSTQKLQNVKIEGIVGMGGSGKTTLAKELFNRKCLSFEKSSFIFEVRAAAQNDLHKKQKKLLQDLGISDLSFDNVEEGKRILSNRLRYVRALIVLDDIDRIDQLDALLPNIDNLGSDSLVIVTTRELGVLKSWDIYSTYKMPGLNDLEARQLFCWHAFLQPSPLFGFENLVEGFLKVCNGLPLSVMVLGGQLHGRNSKDYWKSQLNKISRIWPSRIIERLKVSFDALDREEQEMFLDVACFLIGEEKSVAIAVWDGSGWSGVHGMETLENKCLVEVHKERIRMHDHLRHMGRQIATTHSPCRYWSPQQIQKKPNARTPIRGISSKTLNSQFFLKTFVGTSRRGFKRPRSSLGSEILLVSGNELTEEIASLSEDLVWLRWDSFPHRNLPSWIPLKNLAVLQISSADFEEMWGDNVVPPLKLIELNITSRSTLLKVPASIGRLKHLRKIKFNNGSLCCSLPEEFCDLQSLEHLELTSFVKLSSLPDHFGKLQNLRHIKLYNCKELKMLPVSFKHLIHLEFLDLIYCKKLKLRSDMLENIAKLETLDLSCCEEVEELPSQITNQVSLKSLSAYETSLKHLQNDIGLLQKLNYLSIGSNLLTSLPNSLANLSCLTSLDIRNPRLELLPDFFGNLSLLTHLVIESSLLTSLPSSLGNLLSLTYLFIDCPLLTSLPSSLSNLSCLTCLDIINCSKLQYIPHCIWGLKLLGSVQIRHSQVRELPLGAGDFSLPELKFLQLSDTCLSEISITDDCSPSLKDLNISGNAQLIEIRTLPTSINYLDLSGCKVLKSIRCIGGVVNLRTLHIKDCWELDELPNFIHLSLLKEFKMKKCPKVSRIEGIQHCRSLEKLEAETSWDLPGIQCLEKAGRLKELSLKCHTMSAIKPSFQSMKECPCRMEIEGRVSSCVQQVLNSLEFPDLRVMQWQEVFDRHKLTSNFPSLLCSFQVQEEGNRYEEGPDVHIAVFRQDSDFSFSNFQSRYKKYQNVSDSKAMAVAGEDAKVVEAFYKILALLE